MLGVWTLFCKGWWEKGKKKILGLLYFWLFLFLQVNDIICPYGSPNWIAKYWRRIYVCRISRSSTEDTFVIYELWHKGGKPDSGWGQRGNQNGRGQYHDYRALLCDLLHRILEARTLGMCYPQQSSNCAWAISLDEKKRFLGAHGVARKLQSLLERVAEDGLWMCWGAC